jgi:outer membrane protein TolC
LGSGTMLEQIDAQTALTSARAQKIQAEYDYCFAQSRVKKAIGLLK